MVGADISPVVVHAKHSEKIREIFQIISLVSIQLVTVSPILNDTNLSKRLKWERDREKRAKNKITMQCAVKHFICLTFGGCLCELYVK